MKLLRFLDRNLSKLKPSSLKSITEQMKLLAWASGGFDFLHHDTYFGILLVWVFWQVMAHLIIELYKIKE